MKKLPGKAFQDLFLLFLQMSRQKVLHRQEKTDRQEEIRKFLMNVKQGLE